MTMTLDQTKKASLLNEIKQGLKEIKEIQQGKRKAYSMSDLFSKKIDRENSRKPTNV